jgi:two-component system response regulator HydG
MLVVDLDGLLDVDDLPDDIPPLHAGSVSPAGAILDGQGNDALIGKPLDEVERYYIMKALERAEGKRDEAANMLGMGERTLYRKIKDWGLIQ